MNKTILILIILNLIINLIATYSYSARIAGVRTQKIAVSLSVFNILVLISRTANGFQAPLLANFVEKIISNQYSINPEYIFRIILFSYSVATVIGIITTPFMQRFLTHTIKNIKENGSVLTAVIFTVKKIDFQSDIFVLPKKENIQTLKDRSGYNFKILLYNAIGTAILSVGVLSSIYAGYLNPEFRATSSNLSALINGFATLIMFLVVDPYLSILVDNVQGNKNKEIIFRKEIIRIMFARLIGTILAQFLFIPCSELIAFVSGKF